MADINDFNQTIIDEFRANDGKVGGPFAGAPMLLLTHTGAKSGKVRTTPLVCTHDGDDMIIIASKRGAPEHPAWYHNLVVNPAVTVEVGTDRFDATAVEVAGGDRQRLFDAQSALMPAFKEYQEKTTRTIPVLRLVRR